MAWDTNSSYQGAASGAATGAVAGGGVPGAIIGGAIGFVAGGLMGGSSKDAAKKAEEDRKREIEAAIHRQNQSTYSAKAQAEQWSLADIGVGREDRLDQAMFDRKQLSKDVGVKVNAVDANYQAQGAANQKVNPNDYTGPNSHLIIEMRKREAAQARAQSAGVQQGSAIAQQKFNANEGIIASYENEPLKY